MKKTLTDYQLILFDMDGTLYFQRPLQFHMGMKMAASCLSRQGLKEIIIILKFRKLREHWQKSAQTGNSIDIDHAQYSELAASCKVSVDEIERIVQKWIYKKPLDILCKYRDNKLITLIESLMPQKTQLAIYSDYPATDKRNALQLPPIPCFYGGQPEIGCMKPDPKGILTIMSHYNIQNPSDVLMIGDRESKDGRAASAAGTDCLILKRYKFLRNKQYRELLSK